MSWFRRTRRTERTHAKPTRRERQAAERTARAEASLRATEQKIHRLAAEVRSDLKGSP